MQEPSNPRLKQQSTPEAVMQDVIDETAARESRVPFKMLESVRELNHRFLDLFTTPSCDWSSLPRLRVPPGVAERIAPLSSSQKAAAANCPYALFDLRFDDGGYWQERLANVGRWGVADAGSGDPTASSFVSLALFFAWHVASSETPASRVLLGMSEVTAATFRSATIDRVPVLVADAAANLTARWSNWHAYWSALINAAAQPNFPDLRRIQLYGLQLAAASRLM
jgi:hypothetical protein